MKTIDKNLQIEEAIKRLKMLNLHPNVLKDFKKGVINRSDSMGALYWLNDNEKFMVKQFEEIYHAVVYHVIHSYTNFGELYNILYVSDSENEWEEDEQDIKEGYAVVYVKNIDDDMCSEFGSIGFKQVFGGLIRTC